MQVLAQDDYSLIVSQLERFMYTYELESLINSRYPDALAGVWRQVDGNLRVQHNWGYGSAIVEMLKENES